MDITLFVGNGFDKALGLKTGYDDFYDWLRNRRPDDPYVDIMRRRVYGDKELWSDFEKGMGDFTKNFVEEGLTDGFDPWKSSTIGILKEYLNGLNTSEAVKNIINSNDNVKQCYRYIQGFVVALKLLKPDLFGSANKTVTFHVITLNYTDSLDQLATSMSYRNDTLFEIDATVLHPHGRLSTGIILGVNDASQIKNEKIRQSDIYSNKMIKSAQIKEQCQEIKETAISHIENSQIICLYGVSLGETDCDWWKLLGSWLQRDKKHYLVIFGYAPIENEITRQRLDAKKNIFLSRAQVPDDVKKKLKKQILVYFQRGESPFVPRRKQVFPLIDGVNLPMIFVEAGSFTMGKVNGGNTEDVKEHTVEIKKDFYIGEFQVTQEQYKAVVGENPSNFSGEKLPVEQVTWYEAMNFCKKLNEKKLAPWGYRFSLPTETQWEYAARGGKKSNNYKYSGSDNIDAVAWYEKNSAKSTHEVGTKSPNELGVYDMCGNVWEWCLDDYSKDSSKSKPEFVRNDDDKSSTPKVDRGGAYDCGATGVALRSNFEPDKPRLSIGFRVVLVPDKY